MQLDRTHALESGDDALHLSGLLDVAEKERRDDRRRYLACRPLRPNKVRLDLRPMPYRRHVLLDHVSQSPERQRLDGVELALREFLVVEERPWEDEVPGGSSTVTWMSAPWSR